MIVYNPLDGHTIAHPIESKPRHCFLMTRLGHPIPKEVNLMRSEIESICKSVNFEVIDANTIVTGRDFLLKIWRMIASVPLSIGLIHEDIAQKTQANIFYELGVAQAIGNETVIVKSSESEIPSDLIRTEYIEFDKNFRSNFKKYLASLDEQAKFYETVADQLDKDPILALDYLRRAFLISENVNLRKKAEKILKTASIEDRATNSVERNAANF